MSLLHDGHELTEEQVLELVEYGALTVWTHEQWANANEHPDRYESGHQEDEDGADDERPTEAEQDRPGGDRAAEDGLWVPGLDDGGEVGSGDFSEAGDRSHADQQSEDSE
jgi:hypothetical protein